MVSPTEAYSSAESPDLTYRAELEVELEPIDLIVLEETGAALPCVIIQPCC